MATSLKLNTAIVIRVIEKFPHLHDWYNGPSFIWNKNYLLISQAHFSNLMMLGKNRFWLFATVEILALSSNRRTAQHKHIDLFLFACLHAWYFTLKSILSIRNSHLISYHHTQVQIRKNTMSRKQAEVVISLHHLTGVWCLFFFVVSVLSHQCISEEEWKYCL